MAFLILEAGLSPSEYWQLSLRERNALVAAVDRKNKAKRK